MSQTDRPGVSQARHPRGPLYVTPELMPQGMLASTSPRGASMLILFTNPQRPLYGTGLTSASLASSSQLIPGQGPIVRGY